MRVLWVVGFALLLSFPVSAQTITVAKDGSGDFTTIQEAIDYSWDGDTVMVWPGIYIEDIWLLGRAITLTSQNPDDPNVVENTIINGTVTCNLMEGPDTVITGLTIQGVGAGGAGIPVTSAQTSQSAPAIYGSTVVWSAGSPSHIYGKNLLMGEEFQISSGAGESAPAIWGDIVVWVDTRNGNQDIYGKNLATGVEFAVCTDTSTQNEPAIYGDIVVWTDYRNSATGGSDIYGRNLSTGLEFAVCTQLPANQLQPAIYGNIVVWVDFRSSASSSDIYGRNLAGC